jgi:hypothetical protein
MGLRRTSTADELRHRLASAHDADWFAGSSLRDQSAEMRLRVGEIDLLHDPLLTIILVT